MANPQRGEVWLVDLGMVAKIRPAMILSVTPGVDDRDLATLVPHTTSVRQSVFESTVDCNFLASGAFNAQDIHTISRGSKKFLRKLGELNTEQLADVEAAVKRWLGFENTEDKP